MFNEVSRAEFVVEGKKASFMIDSDMPISSVLQILNRLTHFCVQRLNEYEAEEALKQKEAEMEKKPELEMAEEVKEQPQDN